ncbi:phage tail protein I [Hydrogenovibrio sp. 3SP14C1]|uniref:phage tail protein I n=1 Tax=Hydrogenovibrio sp. 3SP14C1 TaxID=3038774 RepID=UPI0024168E93|nr:phage tail protein I [Hydrogenovibrio sp. 3SP14C1]MDG4811645.1 phage tail protein I [Hydrogenovibrio sp. 3SP14C1]
MSDLLPLNTTQFERDVDATIQRTTSLPVFISTLWSAKDCPEYLLGYLAWSLSVDEWDESWPEDIKREVIRTAIEIHRHKGSVYAVKLALEKSGMGGATIYEGRSGYTRDGSMIRDGFVLHGDDSEWAVYKVVTNLLLSITQANLAKRLLNAAAPERCHLWGLDFTAARPLHNGVIYRDGTYTRGVF